MWTSTVRDLDVAVASPHRVEDPVAREDPPGMFEEMAQQLELGRAERHRGAAAAHLVGGDVELEVLEAQRHAGKCGTDPAEQGPDPRRELNRAERLGHIIVRPGLQAADPVRFLAAGGQHDDRQVGRVGRAAQPAAHLDSRQLLQHPVEDGDVRAASLASSRASSPLAVSTTSNPSFWKVQRSSSTIAGSSSASRSRVLATGRCACS